MTITATPTARQIRRTRPTSEAPARPTCTTPRCSHPTNPATNYRVCGACLDGLCRDLRELPDRDGQAGLLAELEVTLTRQDVSGGEHIPEPPEEARTGDGPPAASTVLMFRPMASAVGAYLRLALDHWTGHMLGALHVDPAHALRPTRTPDQRALEQAAWLARHPDGIGSDPDAGALVENLRWAIEDVRRVVFPRLLAYAGPCDCGEQLYAEQAATHVRCKTCRARWVIAERMGKLREQAEGVFLGSEDMSRALPRLAAGMGTKPLTAAQIRGHGDRGRLEQHRPDPRTWTVDVDGAPVPPAPRYKVAEVIALMETLLLEEQERQARRARAQSASIHDRVLAAHERFREALQA